MKRFIKILGVLFILLLQFTSCLDDDHNYRNPVYFFYDEPVVVDQTGKYPFIRNESYSFYVPGLADDTVLKVGDLLWTSFIVNLDDNDGDYSKKYTDSKPFYTASHFQYKTIDSAKVIIPADAAEFQSYLSDDYSASIGSSVLYDYAIDSLWFFGFRQKDNLSYIYELVLNPETETGSGNYPTLYIRAKQTNASAASSGSARSNDGYMIFAFDVADFFNYCKYYPDNLVHDKLRFNLKYKTGVDANGNDIYRAFMSNPISWNY